MGPPFPIDFLFPASLIQMKETGTVTLFFFSSKYPVKPISQETSLLVGAMIYICLTSNTVSMVGLPVIAGIGSFKMNIYLSRQVINKIVQQPQRSLLSY